MEAHNDDRLSLGIAGVDEVLHGGLLSARYLEVRGDLRKAIGVLKNRLGAFEPTLREVRTTDDGLWIGELLDDLRKVLTGTPEWDDTGDSGERERPAG